LGEGGIPSAQIKPGYITGCDLYVSCGDSQFHDAITSVLHTNRGKRNSSAVVRDAREVRMLVEKLFYDQAYIVRRIKD